MAKILVMEDDPQLRDMLHDVLTAAGHQVLLASDGREGLALYQEHRPQLILADIFMPETDGLEVIIRLADVADLKIIAMSGGRPGRTDPLEDAMHFGAWRILDKPFRRETLLGLVNEALAG